MEEGDAERNKSKLPQVLQPLMLLPSSQESKLKPILVAPSTDRDAFSQEQRTGRESREGYLRSYPSGSKEPDEEHSYFSPPEVLSVRHLRAPQLGTSAGNLPSLRTVLGPHHVGGAGPSSLIHPVPVQSWHGGGWGRSDEEERQAFGVHVRSESAPQDGWKRRKRYEGTEYGQYTPESIDDRGDSSSSSMDHIQHYPMVPTPGDLAGHEPGTYLPERYEASEERETHAAGGSKGKGKRRDESEEGEEHPKGKVSRKVLVACDFCRSRKLKCTGTRPKCYNCEKRETCVYAPKPKRRGPGKAPKGSKAKKRSGQVNTGENVPVPGSLTGRIRQSFHAMNLTDEVPEGMGMLSMTTPGGTYSSVFAARESSEPSGSTRRRRGKRKGKEVEE